MPFVWFASARTGTSFAKSPVEVRQTGITPKVMIAWDFSGLEDIYFNYLLSASFTMTSKVETIFIYPGTLSIGSSLMYKFYLIVAK